MDQVAETARDYYNNHLRGGEGHMEVGKLILNVAKKKATMTLSVKPFGCMPSSGVSDGVQSMVTEKYPEAIYCPIETSGDGAVNVYSRVQMMLFKARLAAKDEYLKTLEQAGLTPEQLKAKLNRSWWKRSALYYPKHGTVAAMASNVAQEVAGVEVAAH
jgi:predicted nucleotide-binding protein (sugar kinase/HSP70/actin superfamily)